MKPGVVPHWKGSLRIVVIDTLKASIVPSLSAFMCYMYIISLLFFSCAAIIYTCNI